VFKFRFLAFKTINPGKFAS